MELDRYYDSKNYCLKTERVSPKLLVDRIVGHTEHSSPILTSSTWYSGFIDRNCFSPGAQVSYLIGYTGPETRVDISGVIPIGTFTVRK